MPTISNKENFPILSLVDFKELSPFIPKCNWLGVSLSLPTYY